MRLVLFFLLAAGVASSPAHAQTPAVPVPPAALAVSVDSGAVLPFNGWYLPRYAPKAAEDGTPGRC